MKRILSILLIFILFIFVSGALCEDKIVALTFDDGPNPSFLVKALPFFQEENIKVTFFVIGSRAKEYPQWIKRAYDEGHEIENHSWSHICLARPSQKSFCPEISLERALSEINRTRELIEELTGYRTRFLRPPYLAMTEKRKREIEENIDIKVLVDSNLIDSLDWAYKDPLRIKEKVIREVKNRPGNAYVILFHEKKTTMLALPDIVKYFKEKNYKFVRIDEFVKHNSKV